MVHTVYVNGNAPEVMRIELAIGFALKNAAKSKKFDVYNNQLRINLFYLN